ncbi:MAG: response regulator [Chitinophagaceae bacterium]
MLKYIPITTSTALTRLAMCLCLLLFSCHASAQKVFTLYADSLDKNMELSFVISDWYFHTGDLPQPVVSTQGWDTLSRTDFAKDKAPYGWKGLGWFGVWLKVDEKAVNKKIDLRIYHDGASEIYMDGKPISGFGKVGLSPRQTVGRSYRYALVPLWFGDTLPHLLAIRYANFADIHPDFLGFETYIGDYEAMHAHITRNSNFRSFMPMCAAAQWMLALMHLLLFFFYPRQRLNLYFAAYTAIMGAISMFSYLYYEANNPIVSYYAEYMGNECMPLLMWFSGLLLYNIGYAYIPVWKRTMLMSVSCIYFVTLLAVALWHSHLWEWRQYRFDYSLLLFFVFLVFFCDELWGIFRAIRQGKPGLWLIVIGVASAVLAITLTWLDIFSIWPARQNGLRLFTLSVGTLVFPICVSLYLALDFTRTNKSLAVKLQEVETLSARALQQEAEKVMLLENEAVRLEQTVRQRTAELQQQTDKLRELDTVKSRFFTNITHEFKTPLTLISNPAQELLAMNENPVVQYHASLIKKNAERLLQLINQLLDLSKLESGLMHVTQSPVELVSELKKYVGNHISLAKQKGIQFIFSPSLEELWILSDHDKLEKITSNLLSNALKFTDSGKVEIILGKNDATFTLSIKDTGQGIAASKLPYIFERFYQADPSDARSAEGTGIGLALTKELVGLMGGSIRAESVENLYTLMEVTLPLLPAVPQQQDDMVVLPAIRPETVIASHDMEALPIADNDSNLVLVIEDNDELRKFIVRSLAIRFRVMDAPDGKKGVALAQEHIPNIVITDIMMPGMDGYEVCTTLKSDERTSHIPVIMLTAKSGTESRIQGIETGADAYLGKPFVQKELFAIMENLMKTRRLLQEKYSSNTILVKTEALPSIEKRFLDRVQSVVRDHLDDELFGADQLASQIGLSRTQLHRKLKALLDKSPGDFIRTFRLEHAHHLLRERAATVSEVAYMVGFSNPASFSASFSRHFGFPPSEVAAKKA